MTQSRTDLLRRTLAALALATCVIASGCVGTPLPDPPSFSSLTSWSTTPQPGTARFVGRRGAVSPGGATLRITDPPTPGELVSTNADGSFGRILPGMAGDTIYVEIVTATSDDFEGAYVLAPDGTLMPTAAGPDDDGDGTPNIIDCAPTDRTMAGQRCGMTCTADSDCATGQRCFAGVCSATAGCTAETCNDVDDDCDGIVDEGDPGGGVACMPSTGMCPGTDVCGAGGIPMCAPITPGREICGNGIDDDCNGLVDDGC